MSARSIRRAAERKAQKLANNTGTGDAHVPAPILPPAAPALEPSAARITANRENAQKSCGPKTLEGKAISSLNAVKTGLTGRTVLLPSDDAAEYESHILAYENDFKPVGQQECDLVQSIANIVWRLKRITCLEQAFFAKGRVEFADMFAGAEPSHRSSLIELHTYEVYEKKFRNLNLQEARLSRRREKEIAELRLLQQERKQKHQDALKDATRLYLAAKEDGKTFDPADHGFEFSIDAIQAALEVLRTARIAQQVMTNDYAPLKAGAKAA